MFQKIIGGESTSTGGEWGRRIMWEPFLDGKNLPGKGDFQMDQGKGVDI